MKSEKQLTTEEQYSQEYAKRLDLDYISLLDFVVPSELFEILSVSYAVKLHVVPYRKEGETLFVVVSDLSDLDREKKLQTITGCKIHFLISSAKDIEIALRRSESSVKLLEHVSRAFESDITIDEDTVPIEQVLNTEDIDERDPASVVQLINSIILAALQRKASDIHIESSEQSLSIKYRIDGVLYFATKSLGKKFHTPLVTRLKVMSELDIAEKRIPQDGRFKLSVNHRAVDFRVSILPTSHGEDVVIRILDKMSLTDALKNLSINYLGLDDEIVKQLRRAICEPYGLVLITGPTGSGKTTTLYAALTELNDGEVKIITVEDPVEYQIPGITQVQVNEKKQLTFARGLRSILRHDPDKIMVGEIRDSETAKIAIQSALTGHLVFTSVHANNTFDVIDRLYHMDLDVHSIVSALNCVLAQRLVRKICSSCKKKIHIDDKYLEFSGLDPEKYRHQDWYEGEGCDACYYTGYAGRSAIAEFLKITPRMRDVLLKHSSTLELRKIAYEEGMLPFRKAGIAKALAGETSLKEVNRVIFIE